MADAKPSGLTGARDMIENTLRAELSRLLDGTVDTIDGPIRDAANRLVVAARRGDRALADECRDQLAIEIEAAQLKARSGAGAVLGAVLERGVGLLFDGLVAGLTGARLR